MMNYLDKKIYLKGRIFGFIIVVSALLLSLSGCSEESGADDTIYYRAKLEAETVFDGLEIFIQGFDFSYGYAMLIDQTEWDIHIDLALRVEVDNFGTGNGLVFYNTREAPAYIDMGNVLFEDVLEAPEYGYDVELQDIADEHTYCIITAEGYYVKIYILDLEYGSGASGEPYGWIEFDWDIQADGSRFF